MAINIVNWKSKNGPRTRLGSLKKNNKDSAPKTQRPGITPGNKKRAVTFV